mgnify:CR=1 FL=1
MSKVIEMLEGGQMVRPQNLDLVIILEVRILSLQPTNILGGKEDGVKECAKYNGCV